MTKEKQHRVDPFLGRRIMHKETGRIVRVDAKICVSGMTTKHRYFSNVYGAKHGVRDAYYATDEETGEILVIELDPGEVDPAFEYKGPGPKVETVYGTGPVHFNCRTYTSSTRPR